MIFGRKGGGGAVSSRGKGMCPWPGESVLGGNFAGKFERADGKLREFRQKTCVCVWGGGGWGGEGVSSQLHH